MTPEPWNTPLTWMLPRCSYHNAPSLQDPSIHLLFLHVQTNIFFLFLSCLYWPPDNQRHIWWQLRSVIPCPDRPQYPRAEPPPGLFEGWASWGGAGGGDGPGRPQGRPCWTLLQPGRNDGQGAAAAHWCEFHFAQQIPVIINESFELFHWLSFTLCPWNVLASLLGSSHVDHFYIIDERNEQLSPFTSSISGEGITGSSESSGSLSSLSLSASGFNTKPATRNKSQAAGTRTTASWEMPVLETLW